MSEAPDTSEEERGTSRDASPLRDAFDLFLEICDLDDAEMARRLDERCAGRPDLRVSVERLVARDRSERSDPGLRTGEGGEATLGAGPLPAPAAGATGRYRLLRPLGEGGSGSVYEAEQIAPRRLVALKVLRGSALLGASAQRRFALEAEVLARLQHPGIAQVFDAGFGQPPIETSPGDALGAVVAATAGPAWIAMELVRGTPIDAAAARRRLDVRQRLELVVAVCDAVAFAHQKGVIHRDLKPANILLAEPDPQAPIGRVKVLDFGIARVAGPEWATAALGADDRHAEVMTGPGQLLGTLPYMSPEQVAGESESIDMRSDVYSLGVVLFELLVGRRPFELKGRAIDEAVRVIRHEDPLPPSRSVAPAESSRLRGDLDAIVMRALAKRPDDRYRSVAALADDLRAHLRGEPVAARSSSAIYVLARKARRHRVPIAASVLVLVSIVAIAVRATVDAERFSQLAEDAHTAERTAQRASEALVSQLGVARVERARLLAAAGNVADAIDSLRGEGTTASDQRLLWAAREVAARHPCRREWAPHLGQVRALAERGDGLVLSAGDDGRVVLSDPEQGQLLCADAGSAVFCGGLDRERDVFVVGCEDGSVQAFDARSLEPLGEIARHGSPVRSVSAADGVVASGDGQGTVLFTTPGAPPREAMRGHRPVVSVLVLSDHEFVAGDEGGEATYADLGRIVDDMPATRIVTRHEGSVLSLAYDAARGRLVSGGTDRLVNLTPLYDPTVASRSVDVGNGSIRVIAVDPPTGDIMISGWWTLDRWDPELRVLRRIASTPSGPTVAVFAPERGDAVTGHYDGSIRLWSCRDLPVNGGGVFVPGASGRSTAVISRDGRILAYADGIGTLGIADARTGETLVRPPSHARRVRSLALSPDGSMVASIGDDRMLQLASTSTGEVYARLGGADGQTACSVAFSDDGRRIAAAFLDQTVRTFVVPTMGMIDSFHISDRQILSVAWSPDGTRIAVASRDMAVRLYTDRGDPIATARTPDAPWVLAFSPDGRRLAVGEWSRSTAIFDAATLSLVRRIVGGSGLVTGVAWLRSSDGISAPLATSSADGSIRVFESNDGRGLFEFVPFAHADTISCTADAAGRYLAASGTAGEIGVWDLERWDDWARRGAGLR